MLLVPSTTGRTEFTIDDNKTTYTNQLINTLLLKNIVASEDYATKLPAITFQMQNGNEINWVFANISDRDEELAIIMTPA